MKPTREKEEGEALKVFTFTDEANLGFGVAKCLSFLKTHGGIDDGLEDDDDIDLDRVDEFGRKLKPMDVGATA